MTTRIPLKDVPVGEPFMFVDRPAVYEHRGNGWYAVYGRSYTGGPWHEDRTVVAVDAKIPQTV